MAAPDALVKVAETFLANGEAAGTGGDRHLVLFHVEQDPLAADGTLAATLDDGTRVSAETFRRISCDASLVAVKSDAAGNPLDVGHRTRTIPPALRRALWSRDRGCRFPACPHRLYIHTHHIDHWIHGGETNLDNLVLLCSTHHRLLHEGGFRLTRTTAGELTFRDAKGRTIDPVPQAEPADGAPLAMSTWLERSGVAINAETSMPDWYGDAVDYDEVIAGALPLSH